MFVKLNQHAQTQGRKYEINAKHRTEAAASDLQPLTHSVCAPARDAHQGHSAPESGVFTQMTQRQNFDAMAGRDWTHVLTLSIGHRAKFDARTLKF